MANETIYGCVDWDDGGKVKFVQNSGCCHYSACVEWTGVHAGQVKIIIDTTNCSDTYYACVDWTTGKFQAEVPDNCCTNGENGDIICGCCCDCWDTHKSPLKYTAVITGVISCDGKDGADINGTWDLDWNENCNDGGVEGIWCIWGSAGYFTATPPYVYFSYGEPGGLTRSGFIAGRTGDGDAFGKGLIGSQACSTVICFDQDNNFVIGGCGVNSGYGGHCKTFPNLHLAWAEDTFYSVGDIVTYDGEYYICIQGHTSCSTGCPNPDEPTQGITWFFYWEVATCPTGGSCE